MQRKPSSRRHAVAPKVRQVELVDSKNNPEIFTLVRMVDKGASAKIYKSYAISRPLHPVALKRFLLQNFRGFESDFQELLQREKDALFKLSKLRKRDRIYVTEFYGHFTNKVKSEHWLAMELCDGGSLAQVHAFHKTPLKLGTVAAILSGVLKGLSAIHQAGFVHGDLKSGNILLSSPGIVKICDFGLTVSFISEVNENLHALGTLEYESPEQLRKSLALDDSEIAAHELPYNQKTDVWAVGVIGLEMLLGSVPLKDLRGVNERTFSWYIAEMADTNHDIFQGSGLFKYFYGEDLRHIYDSNNLGSDLDKLCTRYPELGENRRLIARMILRPELHGSGKTPDPAAKVPKLIAPKLFLVNKCLSFIAFCLFINFRFRPCSSDLMKHEFVKACCNELSRLEVHFDDIKKMDKARTQKKDIAKKYQTSLTLQPILSLIERRNELIKERVLAM